MNKALILLLVTLVQSQSDGVLLPDSNTDDGFRSSRLEDRDDRESPYPADVSEDYDQSSRSYGKRSATSDAFTRRSSLDKNFMRFGRGDDADRKRCGRTQGKPSFYRFGRGLKDNFIRFGRARDDFVRFGRGGGKDGFIRFGRPDNFIRFGKADESFAGFARDRTEEDRDGSFSSEEPFERPERSRGQDDFARFGKSGKNGTNFLRFGRSDAEADDADEAERESEDARRKRRNAGRGPAPEAEAKRSAPFFAAPPENFPRRPPHALVAAFRATDGPRNSGPTPFFPAFPGAPRGPGRGASEAKRTRGGGNFIRFG